MVRVVRRLSSRALASSFGRWESKMAKAKYNRHVMAKIVLRMSQKGLSIAMEQWMHVTGTIVAARKEEERQKRIIAKVIHRHKTRSVWTALELWAENVCEITKNRETMKRVVLRLCHRSLSRALDVWTHGVEIERGERAAEERRRRVMANVLSRMQHTRASAAVSRWREGVSERKILTATTSRVLVRWKNKVLVMGLDAWRGHTVDEARNRALIDRIALIINKSASSGVRCLRRVAFLTIMEWQFATYRSRRMKAASRKASSRLQHRLISISIQEWFSEAHACHRLRLLERKVLTRLLHRSFTRSIQVWKDISRRRAQRSNFLAKVCTSFLRKWLRRTLASSWQIWAQFINRHQTFRAMIFRILQRHECQTLVISWFRWRNVLQVIGLKLAWLPIIAGHASHARLAKSMKTWKSQFRAHRQLRTSFAKMQRRLQLRRATTALVIWMQMSRCAALSRKSMATNALCSRNRALAKAISAWIQVVQHEKQFQARRTYIKRQRMRSRVKTLRECFFALRNVPMQFSRHTKFVQVRFMVRSKNNMVLHFALQLWSLVLRLRQLQHKHKTNLKNRVHRHAIQLTFSCWRNVTASHKLDQEHPGSALQLAYEKLHEARLVWSNAAREMDEMVKDIEVFEINSIRKRVQLSQATSRIIHLLQLRSMHQAWGRWTLTLIRFIRTKGPSGVGMTLQEKKLPSGEILLTVTELSPNSAALASGGISPGDVLLSVDGKRVKSIEDAAHRILGEHGSSVELHLERAGQPFFVAVRRGMAAAGTVNDLYHPSQMSMTATTLPVPEKTAAEADRTQTAASAGEAHAAS